MSKPNLQSPEELEKLIDARTERILPIFERMEELDFTVQDRTQVADYATQNGAYQQLPTTKQGFVSFRDLSDIDLGSLSYDLFETIRARAIFAIKKIADLKKSFHSNRFFTNRKERRRLARTSGQTWKQFKALEENRNVSYTKPTEES